MRLTLARFCYGRRSRFCCRIGPIIDSVAVSGACDKSAIPTGFCVVHFSAAWWPSRGPGGFEQALMEKFNMRDPNDLPDCWVFNVYNDDKKYIAWHNDQHELFDAVENPADIWSISFGADGLFGVKMTQSTPLHSSLWKLSTQRLQEGYLPLRNGDFVLMGGSCVGATSSAGPPVKV